MDSFKRIVGVYLILVAAVVAIHTVAEPLYYTSTEASPYSPHWNKINALMVLAIVLGLVFGCMRKRSVGGEEGSAVTREYLEAHVLFYGLLFVGILFFWNFFNGDCARDRIGSVDFDRRRPADHPGRNGRLSAQIPVKIYRTARQAVRGFNAFYRARSVDRRGCSCSP